MALIKVQATGEDLRKLVWDSLVKHAGNREAAAEELGKSRRTIDRYIRDFNLFADLEKHGLMRNAGPPRLENRRPVPTKFEKIIEFIKANDGEIDYGVLTTMLYGNDNKTTRGRLFVALSELKAMGKIGKDDERWFVI